MDCRGSSLGESDCDRAHHLLRLPLVHIRFSGRWIGAIPLRPRNDVYRRWTGVGSGVWTRVPDNNASERNRRPAQEEFSLFILRQNPHGYLPIQRWKRPPTELGHRVTSCSNRTALQTIAPVHAVGLVTRSDASRLSKEEERTAAPARRRFKREKQRVLACQVLFRGSAPLTFAFGARVCAPPSC